MEESAADLEQQEPDAAEEKRRRRARGRAAGNAADLEEDFHELEVPGAANDKVERESGGCEVVDESGQGCAASGSSNAIARERVTRNTKLSARVLGGRMKDTRGGGLHAWRRAKMEKLRKLHAPVTACWCDVYPCCCCHVRIEELYLCVPVSCLFPKHT